MNIWANVDRTVPDTDGVEQVVVIGSGPAGQTAALYAARANLRPLVVEGPMPGGLLQETMTVENFPGYPHGAPGPEIVADLREQAARFGARHLAGQVDRVDLATTRGDVHRLEVGIRTLRARTVILAMGAAPRRLGVPGEAELFGRGIATCAVCEAPLYAGRATAVIGGGDSAVEEALGLARHARDVTVVHRRTELRAAPVMADRLRACARVTVLAPYVPEAFLPGADGRLAAVRLRSVQSGQTSELEVEGAFLAVGHEPRSMLVRGQLRTDEHGYPHRLPGTRETGRPGVFACGDLVDARYRQAVTAAASGCEAALDAQRYLDTALI